MDLFTEEDGFEMEMKMAARASFEQRRSSEVSSLNSFAKMKM
jgi:hypothetical protein